MKKKKFADEFRTIRFNRDRKGEWSYVVYKTKRKVEVKTSPPSQTEASLAAYSYTAPITNRQAFEALKKAAIKNVQKTYTEVGELLASLERLEFKHDA